METYCCHLTTTICTYDIVVTLLHLILGCVWVYKNNDKVQYDDPTTIETYCQQTCYLYAFWLINTTFIMIGVSIVLCICVGICACCCG